MGLEQLNFAGLNKVEVAIMRLKEFEPLEGYYFADSGGKDSSVVRDLLQVSGVKYDSHYAQGGIDPPELVYFIRQHHPNTIMERPNKSVWAKIIEKGMPRRNSRWCCEFIKEKSGSGRRIVTGIRWQESPRRKSRSMFEVCQTDETKWFLHPIIDWTANMKQTPKGDWIKSGDVWEYIKINNIPYCSLYDEGFKRLGCALCPMATPKQTQKELGRFPKLANAWKRACYRYYEKGGDGVQRWETAEDFWQWWLSRKGEPKVNEAQCIMFDN